MSTIPHTQACQLARANERKALAEYEKEWPGYCRKCGATGLIEWREYHGECHGTHTYETMTEFCEHCTGSWKCPRCGDIGNNNFETDAVATGDKKAKCHACDWTEGMPGAPEVTNPGECGCIEDSQPEKIYPEDDGGHYTCFN